MRSSKFKDLYADNFVKLGSEANKETFVEEVIKDIDKQEEKSSQSTEPIPKPTTTLIDVTDKSKVGRPKVYQEESKVISVRLKMSNYEQARTIGGLYGGYTGYINYLIEQDLKQRKVNKQAYL